MLSRLTLLFVCALAALAYPDAAHAGWGRMFCGWAGLYTAYPMLKIIFTGLILLVCVKALINNVSFALIFWISVPVVIMALAPDIVYVLSGEDCTVPEDVPHSSSTPVTEGRSQGSATPLMAPESAPAGSQLDIQEAPHHGSDVPLPMLEQQDQGDGQPQNAPEGNDVAPAGALPIPEAGPHGSSMPLPMLPQSGQ